MVEGATTCPHGNVIPGREALYGPLVALSDLEPGAEAHVRRISEVAEHDAPDLLREFDAYGIVTGKRLVVRRADASVRAIPVEVDGEVCARDRRLGRAGLTRGGRAPPTRPHRVP